MAYFDELAGNIQAAYAKLLSKKNITGTNGKTLNCGSFGKIIADIKSEISKANAKGMPILETANQIIFKILQSNYFVYENHEMAALIGYLYLRKQNVTVNHYSVDGITNHSTLADIQALTATW